MIAAAPPENAAGLVESKVRRATGTRVSVYDAEAQGLDTTDGRWITVCEDHGSILSHRTKTRARHQAVRPDGWCDGCREHEKRAEAGGVLDRDRDGVEVVKVCSWCPDEKKEDPPDDAMLTHGMCEECAERIMSEEDA